MATSYTFVYHVSVSIAKYENILETNDITKRFGDVVANDRVNLSVRRGEIHGILGEREMPPAYDPTGIDVADPVVETS